MQQLFLSRKTRYSVILLLVALIAMLGMTQMVSATVQTDICSAAGAGWMGQYNLIVTDDLSTNSDVENRTFVGDDFIGGSSANFGLNLPNNFSATTPMLEIAGTVNSGNPVNVNAGSVRVALGNTVVFSSPNVGYDINGRRFNVNSGNSGGNAAVDNNLPTKATQIASDLASFSSALAGLTANNTATIPNGQPGPLIFNVTTVNANGVAVFNVSGANVFNNNKVQQIEINNQVGATAIVINVTGASINWTDGSKVGSWLTGQTGRAQTLWNFHQATSINLNSKNFMGALLAPNAVVTTSANIDGAAAVKSLTTTSELHQPLLALECDEEEPPAPTTRALTVQKFNDLDGDGVKDNGEAGLSGWQFTVRQNGNTVTSGSTNADGNVVFNVVPGAYEVCETLQSGWENPSDPDLCKNVTVPAGTDVVAGPNSTVVSFADDQGTNSYSVEFLGVQNRTWTYRVTRTGGKNLSHWTLGIASCVTPNTNRVTGGTNGYALGKDGNRPFWGIKWDTQGGTFSFTLDADYPIGTVQVQAKAGSGGPNGDGTGYSTIAGPICNPPAPVPVLQFGNRQLARVTVYKQVSDEQVDRQFAFTFNDGTTSETFYLSDTGNVGGQTERSVFANLVPGRTYTFTENMPLPAGWTLAGAVCSTQSSPEDVPNTIRQTTPVTNGFSIVLQPGEQVYCSFGNVYVPPTGTLEIRKDLVPNGSTSFQYEVNRFGTSDDWSGTFSETNPAVIPNLPPSEYFVDEYFESGFEVGGAVCTIGDETVANFPADPYTINPLIQNVPIRAGQRTICTFTNYVRPTLTIIKQTSPDGSDAVFNFDGSANTTILDTDPSFNLSDGQSKTFSQLSANTYRWTEQLPDGWVLDSVTCQENGVDFPVSVSDTTFSVSLDWADQVTCTVNNRQQTGSLSVTKSVDWNGAAPVDGTTFEICVSGENYPSDCKTFTDPGTLQQTWEGLPVGTYTVTETNPGAEWSVSYHTQNQQVSVADNETSTYTVTNTVPPGSLTVTKSVEWGEATPVDGTMFTICVSGTNYSSYCKNFTYPNTLSQTWTNLPVGTYTVTETNPGANWNVSYQTQNQQVSVAANQTATYTVTNRNTYVVPRFGTLLVNKGVNFNGLSPSQIPPFEICISGANYPSDCRTFTYPNTLTQIWYNLPVGTYTVTETNPGSEWSVSYQTENRQVTVIEGRAVNYTVFNRYIPDVQLNLTAECRVGDLLYWRVTGDNATNDVNFTWTALDTNQTGSGQVDAGQRVYFTTTWNSGAGVANNTRISWTNPATGQTVSRQKAHNQSPCVYHVTFTKTWTGADASPVQNGTILTAESSIATATCGYTNGVWDCDYTRKSNGGSLNDLEVPFGETYSVTEVAVAGWQAVAGVGSGFEGVEGFDVSQLPNALVYDLSEDRYCESIQGQLAKFCSHEVVNELIPFGDLTVTKAINWNGATPVDGTTFNICITGPSYASVEVEGACQTVTYPDDLVAEWNDLTPGQYSVSEPGLDTVRWQAVSAQNVQVAGNQTAEVTVTNTHVTPRTVSPILECVVPNNTTGFTAYFGYNNPNAYSVTIAVGTNNRFSPAPQDRGQPSTFAPGRTPFYPNAAFSVDFGSGDLVWTLNGRTATANGSTESQRCQYHIFIQKVWQNEDGTPINGLPEGVDLSGFSITATSSLETLTCTYVNGVLTCTSNLGGNEANDGLDVLVGSSYTVSESGIPAGWVNVSGLGEFTQTVGADNCGVNGLAKNCTHTVVNGEQPRGTVNVTKQVVGPEAQSGSFTICLNNLANPLPEAERCQTTNVLGGGQQQTLTWQVPPGSYTVSEENPGAAWVVSYSPTNRTVNVTVGGTSSATVTNTYRQVACPATEFNEVVFYQPGLAKNGETVRAERQNTANAEGFAQNNDTLNFLSLGFGGVAIIEFTQDPVLNGTGPDVRIVETSYGDANRAFSQYPERVKVEASQDGVTYVEIGQTSDKDQSYDLGALDWARYFRLTDISDVNSTRFPNTRDSDGFDIDAVEGLNCGEISSDVTVDKSAPTTATVGNQFDYTLTVRNLGQYSATNV
ncbi:MAG: choice-of-anchor A family protein, partial [bacterium]|nr:choice-of-anchor A family protein [bacterium]